MVEQYPKETQNPPFQPDTRPEDQPKPVQRVPKPGHQPASTEHEGSPPERYTRDEPAVRVIAPAD